MSALIYHVVRHRSAVILLAVIVLVAGLVTAARMQLELFPNVSFNTVTVITAYPGASPDTVLNDVTKPVEAAVSTVPEIESLTSTSEDNASVVVLRFKFGTDVNQAEAKVSAAAAALQLPSGAQTPKVSSLDFSAFPISYYVVRSADPRMSLQDTYRLLKSQVQPQIQQIPGVAAADVSGGVDPQINVTLHPDRLAHYGLTVSQVQAALQANSVRLPVGTITANGTALPVVASGTLRTLNQIRNLPIGPAAATAILGFSGAGARAGGPASFPGAGAATLPSRPAAIVRLRDVATVATGHSTVSALGTTPGQIAGYVRFNGKPAISMTIRKNSDANIVQVTDAVNAKLRSLERQYPQLRVGTIYESASGIRESITSLLSDSVFGAVFAILIIFVFLLTVRTTLVTAISIPLSILTAIIGLRVAGYTLNIMTISGVAVAVGRVVDDAIVVLENIYRHIQQGDSRVQSAVRGTAEVARAIIGSTATTIAVFLPIGFIGGILGQFFQPFALTVTIALIASLVVALTVVPALGSLFVRPRRRVREETSLQRVYTPLLVWALDHRGRTLGAAAILFAASLSLLAFIPKGFFPQSHETLGSLTMTLPPGASLERTTAAVSRIESDVVARQPGIQQWETIVGYDNAAAQRTSTGSASNAASMFVVYRSGTDMAAALNRLRSDLKPYGKGGEVVSVQGLQQGPPSDVDLLVRGGTRAELRQATNEVTASLRGVPGLVNLQSNIEARKPQIEIAVDPARALAHGLTPATAALQIRQDLTGQTATTVRLAGQTQDAAVFVQVDPRAADSVEKIRALQIGTPPIRLDAISTVRRGTGPVAIPRREREDVGEITASVNESAESSSVTSQVNKAVAPLVTKWDARGVTIEQAGVSQEISQGFINMGIAMLVAVGMVYLVMVLLFRSLLVPFVILFSLPLAVIGALVALAVTQRELDMSALIGLLMLIGVVVTNAVVLLDLVQQKLDAGLPLHEALVEGGRTRVRPILMTALATVLALMPLAVIGSGGGLIAANLATVVIGGLLVSTLLTLIVVPVVYSLFSSLRGRVTGDRLPLEDRDDAVERGAVPVRAGAD